MSQDVGGDPARFEPSRMLVTPKLRAEVYILLALLLSAPPDQDLLIAVAGLQGDDTAFGQAITALSLSAEEASVAAIAREFRTLFAEPGVDGLMPYASWYLTGTLFSRPLARLRMDMPGFGIPRSENFREPEDQIASLCSMMGGLILGTYGGKPAPHLAQKKFFQRHLMPWAGTFFADLRRKSTACLYVSAGSLGYEFMRLETSAFENRAGSDRAVTKAGRLQP